MDKKRKKAFDECLILWKVLSEMPDTYTLRKPAEFKQNILSRLGIGERDFGCPLCDKFIETSDCSIGNCKFNVAPCYNTAFDKWETDMFELEKHCQKHAIEFYNHLKKLAKEEGYTE